VETLPWWFVECSGAKERTGAVKIHDWSLSKCDSGPVAQSVLSFAFLTVLLPGCCTLLLLVVTLSKETSDLSRDQTGVSHV
jgi:hypothetical protein